MAPSFTRQTFHAALSRVIILPLALFICCGLIGLYLFNQLATVIHWDRHSVEVLAAAHELEKNVIDLETGVRGFQLTGDPVFLDPYNLAQPRVDGQLTTLERLVTDNPDQTNRMRMVRRDAEAWKIFAAESVRRVEHHEPRDREFNEAGKLMMDHVRADLGSFITHEQQLQEERAQLVAPTRRSTFVWALALFLLAMLGTLAWTWAQMRRLAGAYEQSLRETQLEREGFRVTLASIGDAVLVTDRNGRVTFLNSEAERMTGWTLGEAEGLPLRSVFRIINEETRQPVDDPVERVFRERRVVGLANHTVLISRHGVEWMIEDSAAPILDSDRNIDGVILVFQDAGERRRAQRALVAARDEAVAAARAKDIFLAALSHELRTPLNPVLLLASSGATDQRYPPEARREFETIASHIAVEARLIDDLLDLTRAMSGKLSINPERIDPQAALQEAVEKTRPAMRDKNQELQLDFGPGEVAVLGDATRLQQVFWNVLGNAAKFTPRNGRINVTARLHADKNSWMVSVSDTGLGLIPGELAYVFETFTQGLHAREVAGRRFDGLGLGLAIARSIVELHGGTIVASSPGRDQGATFTIELPLASAAAKTEPRAAPAAASPASGPLPGGRILLVEDHAPTLAAVALLMRQRGFTVTPADSIASALAAAEAEAFDLLISDVGLPDGDGYELMRQIGARHRIAGIALSGYGMKSDHDKSRQAGFSVHLTKPVTMRALEEAIRAVLPSPGPGPDGNGRKDEG